MSKEELLKKKSKIQDEAIYNWFIIIGCSVAFSCITIKYRKEIMSDEMGSVFWLVAIVIGEFIYYLINKFHELPRIEKELKRLEETERIELQKKSKNTDTNLKTNNNGRTPRENYAMGKLNIALEYGNLDRFLMGAPGYELEMRDSMGRIINDYYLVMKTIYAKYREDESLELDKKVYETMIQILQTEYYEPLILNLISDIEYQMMSEKQNTAPFKLDCEGLIREIRNNIERNKVRYQKYPSYNMWGRLQNHDENIRLHYGYSILP